MNIYKPALVTLEHVFSTVATHSWVSWHWGTTAGALQCLSRGLEIIIEVSILYHQVTGNNRDRELNLHICLSCGQGHLSGLVPKSRSTTLLKCLQTSSEYVIIINLKYTDTRFISFNETCWSKVFTCSWAPPRPALSCCCSRCWGHAPSWSFWGHWSWGWSWRWCGYPPASLSEWWWWTWSPLW